MGIRATSWIPGETLRAFSFMSSLSVDLLRSQGSRTACGVENLSDWINEWKSAPSDWSYWGAHGCLGCKDHWELKGGKTDELWVPFYLWASASCSQVSFSETSSRTQWPNKAPWRMRTNTLMPQTSPIMVPSAPKCQFCLICHLSLKNIPIMLQSHILASVEVYCWTLQKFFFNILY